MSSSHPVVAVLLSTHNGGPYLAEQLESVRAQTFQQWRVWIRDDQSQDDTLAIATQFAARDSRICLLPPDHRRLGACLSFGALMDNVTGDYFMFCDQDDVWFPDKITVLVDAMRHQESHTSAGTPLLIHSDLEPTDSQRKPIADSLFGYLKLHHVGDEPLRVLLVQNFVIGCSTMFNRALRDLASPIPPEAVMHDWWLALVAAATGRIAFLPRATGQYRQHAANLHGVRRLLSTKSLRRLLNPRERARTLAESVVQAEVLRRLLLGKVDAPVFQRIDAFTRGMRRGGLQGLVRIIQGGVRKQGVARNLLFWFLILSGFGRQALRSF